jgi:phage terminase large subunit GpA-like protein
MDAFTDPKVKRVLVMSSAQVAKTTIIENVLGYFIHYDPSPIMIIQPTIEMAETFSKDRLAPMIRDTPALRDRVAEAGSKSSGNTILHKKFPGGHLTVAGANSAVSLASRPIRILLGDEAAKWQPNSEGSAFKQASKRTTAFWNAKEGYFSTPTSTETEFQKLWQESDQSIFEVPCPGCGMLLVFVFDALDSSLPVAPETVPNRAVLRWIEGAPMKNDEDGRTIRRAEQAWFECLGCGHHISDVERHRAVRALVPRATAPFYGTAGFWLWEGYSPFSSALKIANDWLGALGNSTELQAVKNLTLGLPWRQQGSQQDWKRLFDRHDKSYSLGTVPDGALILTAGVDIQPDRIEIQVVGWGRHRRCWLIDYIVLDGDISRPEVWSDLTKILAIVYHNSRGADFTIRKMAVDSGFESNRVYEWARVHRFGNVAIVRGGPDSQLALVGTPSAAEITSRGQRMDTGVKVHTINVGEFKKELYGRLSLPLPNLEKGEEYEDGFFHFCALGDTEEYCRQLTAEQLVTRNFKGGQRREWEKIRPRNEALDTWDYAAAARVMLGIDRYQEQHWAQLEELAKGQPIVMTAQPPVQNQRSDGWVPKRAGWFK